MRGKNRKRAHKRGRKQNDEKGRQDRQANITLK